MYSGLYIFSKHSGIFLGAHQKIDREARRRLAKILPSGVKFPTAKQILHFEGINGPDAIKVKSPGKNEPWHYVNPFDETDTELYNLLEDHHGKLITAIKAGDDVRIAFEAAWLAHALVDGLTPAHHYPYTEKLVELRGGKSLDTRTNFREKLIMPGETAREKVRNNWKFWGAKGLFTTHVTFELGVATLIKPLRFKDLKISSEDLKKAREIGVGELLKITAREIAVLDMYDRFRRRGWTPKLAYDVRHKLGPTMIKIVALAWYSALNEAGLA